MRREYRVITLSAGLGAIAWTLDAALDYLVFYDGTFWGLLLTDVPRHDLYIRLIVLATFLVFGVSISRMLAARRRSEHALRESKERYRRLFTEMSGGFALHEVVFNDEDQPCDYRFLEVNPGFEQLTGLRRGAILGRSIRDVMPGAEPRWVNAYAEVARTGRSMRIESHLQESDRHYDVVAFSPKRGYIAAILTDATQRRHLEDQLRQAQKMEAVGTLASGIAHDFNNLLTAIYGYTELAKTLLPDDSPAVESLNMVEQAARQASSVTRSLLTFSRKAPGHKQVLNLTVVVNDTVRLLRHVLPASIEVEQTIPPDFDGWVNADAMQLQQVLMNLAVNARDAMPDGGRLRISLHHEPAKPPAGSAGPVGPGNGTAVLVVEDSGIGMTEETQARIFDPFFTTKPRGQGTGLGMAIIHGIITNHGGAIHVESKEGRGTRVAVTLPCCEPAPAPSSQAEAVETVRGRGQVILVVEDDAHVRAIMTTSLRALGYQVIQASNGLEASEALADQRERVQLIVLDMDLPKKGGTAWLQDMRNTGFAAPVIVTTGSPQAPPLQNTFLLRKPFQMSELGALAGRVLSKTSTPMGKPA
ncbi:MAG: response regulator [Phycisphaerales bacterium]|nr:MAG: response regulator [Phycisphaerales bacterium]